jgi:tRNA(Ile)-lysidine synthase
MLTLDPLPREGSRVGVAVSGGADSTALLLALHERGTFSLAAVHINHGWRGSESDGDAAFCEALANAIGIPFHLHRDTSASEGNAEENARTARLQFFQYLIETKALDYVVTAHTLDDQAETVLFRLLRGASLQGLSGIHPVMGHILRPMLQTRRADVIAYLNAKGQRWREDATNADTAFRRNRLRHELLPRLERDWNPEISKALAQTAQLAWDEQQFWESYVSQLATDVFRFRGNTATVDASILMSHPVAVARRLIRWAIQRIKGDIRSIEHAHIEAVLALSGQETTHGRVILPGVDIMRSFEWLQFAPWLGKDEGPRRDRVEERNAEVQLRMPGPGEVIRATAADGSEIRLEAVARNENDTVESSDIVYVDIVSGAVMRPQLLTLRNWRPGDRYRPKGRTSEEKLKVMFQESRVPLWDRGTWPIITIDGQIIWARQFGPVAGGDDDGSAEWGLRISRYE